jgi:threonine synthase
MSSERSIRFVSTRGGVAPASIGQALTLGLAADGGLYVPEVLPRRAADDFADCTTLAETATRLLAPFFAGDALANDLAAMCAHAFAPPCPLVETRTADTYVLELFHGPTAAFKDFGARFLAAGLARLRSPSDPVLTILVATSGDTGAAVAAAFHRVPGFRVVILYPDGRVSPRQAHQLGCFGENVAALRVAGTFDDCQALVKRALTDSALQARAPMSSANSISLGRLLPQMAYFAHAALAHHRAHGRSLSFAVPTGNLGNALACVLARACGLPIGEIVLATNANRTLADFFAGSAYAPRASIATLANAMDVGAPSNFERLRWLISDDAKLRAALSVEAVDDEEIRAAIRRAESTFGVLPCPHTATALVAIERRRAQGDSQPWAAAATAHPAKFEQVIEPEIGSVVTPPAALTLLLARPAFAQPMNVSYDALVRAVDQSGLSRET